MSDLIKSKKDLIKRRSEDSSLDAAINAQIERIQKLIDSKVSRSDQNYFRTFYKQAKEALPEDVFNRIEGVAGTRQHLHQSSHT